MKTNYSQDSEKLRKEIPDGIWILIVYLTMLLMINLIGAFTVRISNPPVVPDWATGDHPMVTARSITTPIDNGFTNHFINNWYRWDTAWYVKIAALGYDANDHSIGFQPLYPLAIRVVKSILDISYLSSALLVSRISCLVALFLLFKITKDQFKSRDVAKKTILLLLVFPSGFFLFAGYTEALYLALALSSWYLFNKKRWFWAGLLGGISSLTRMQGIILTVPLLWIYVVNVFGVRKEDLKNGVVSFIKINIKKTPAFLKVTGSYPPLLAAIMPSLTVATYMIYLKILGMGSITKTYYSNWGTRVLWPWDGLRQLVIRSLTTRLSLNDYIDMTLFIIFIIVVVMGFKLLPIQYSLYNLTMISLVLMVGREEGFLAEFMRYMLIIFPIYMILGKKLGTSGLYYSVVTIFLIFNVMLTWMYVSWFWVA